MKPVFELGEESDFLNGEIIYIENKGAFVAFEYIFEVDSEIRLVSFLISVSREKFLEKVQKYPKNRLNFLLNFENQLNIIFKQKGE